MFAAFELGSGYEEVECINTFSDLTGFFPALVDVSGYLLVKV